MSDEKRENQAKAPQAAAFVESLRDEFGEVKVSYIKAGDFERGKSWDNQEKGK